MPKGRFAKNIIGQRFGRLTVIDREPNKIIKKHCELAMWKCSCDCGNIIVASGTDLRKGHTKSCGCLQSDIARNLHLKHGHSGTKLSSIWSSMIGRCLCKTDKRFLRYGGRGITVCSEWKNDFGSFMEWSIANGYKEGLTLDRIDNDGNYCPDNCQWITRSEHSKKTWKDRKHISE